MEAFFKDILRVESDFKLQILQTLPTIQDWLSVKSSLEDLGERYTICKLDERHEVVLRTWTKNKGTPFHLHPEQSCWFYVIQGVVEETRVPLRPHFTLLDDLMTWEDFERAYSNRHDWLSLQSSKKVSLCKEGSWHYIDDSQGLHKMCGFSDIAMSLHIYKKLVPSC